MRNFYRKQQLLRKFNSVFLKQGLSEVCLDDILLEMDIKKGNFYYYFNSKEDFIRESILECFDKTIKNWLARAKEYPASAKEKIEHYFYRSPAEVEKALRELIDYKDLNIRDFLLAGMEGVKKFD
ncbi:MAG: hypothetical protein C0410_03275 [Anaerolinea sp.]|nr:hypothetical protein [Anaerolinea sp.]